ncbi:MAG: AMP-binding protein [Acidimicrobiales bacterium]
MTFETILTPGLIERYERQGYWIGRTVTDYLDEATARTPDKVAIVDSRRQVTYSQLRAEVDRFAAGLLELGITGGDVVSFQVPNWIEWVVIHLGVSRIGAISNPLIPIYRGREVGPMVALAQSRLVIVPSSFRSFSYPTMMAGLRKDLPSVENLMVIDAQDGEGDLSYEAFIATPWEDTHPAAELAAMRPGANDLTLLIFTSGTTGVPKGVMHTHNTLVAALRPLPERLSLNDSTVVHMASTLAHLTGLLYGARLPLTLGATAVLQDVWNAEAFLELVERHDITYTAGATPFLYDVVAAVAKTDRDVPSLRLFCCMGAPIPRVMVADARDALPNMVVLGGWGQTENALVTLGIPGDQIDKITKTDGYPWPGMEIRVVDETGELLAPGQDGRLQVRGPSLFVGYAEQLDLTREQFTDDWFDTGDLARIDADGYVSLSGRTKDIIIRGGENIPVVHVENTLYENPKLASVAIVGVPDPRVQERACACVTLAPGVTEFTFEEMQAFLNEKGVAKQYWPERLTVMDSLPSTPSGKIQKFELRRMLAVPS